MLFTRSRRFSQGSRPPRSITSLHHLRNRIVCFRRQLNVIKRESPANLRRAADSPHFPRSRARSARLSLSLRFGFTYLVFMPERNLYSTRSYTRIRHEIARVNYCVSANRRSST